MACTIESQFIEETVNNGGNANFVGDEIYLNYEREPSKQPEQLEQRGASPVASPVEQAVPARLAEGTSPDVRLQSAKRLRIATRHETVEQFVAAFHRFCEDMAFFMPNVSRAVGAVTEFSFQLSNGRQVFAGVGAVVEEFTTTQNRFGRTGIVIALEKLGRDSASFFELVLAARAARAAIDNKAEQDDVAAPMVAYDDPSPIAIDHPVITKPPEVAAPPVARSPAAQKPEAQLSASPVAQVHGAAPTAPAEVPAPQNPALQNSGLQNSAGGDRSHRARTVIGIPVIAKLPLISKFKVPAAVPVVPAQTKLDAPRRDRLVKPLPTAPVASKPASSAAKAIEAQPSVPAPIVAKPIEVPPSVPGPIAAKPEAKRTLPAVTAAAQPLEAKRALFSPISEPVDAKRAPLSIFKAKPIEAKQTPVLATTAEPLETKPALPQIATDTAGDPVPESVPLDAIPDPIDDSMLEAIPEPLPVDGFDTLRERIPFGLHHVLGNAAPVARAAQESSVLPIADVEFAEVTEVTAIGQFSPVADEEPAMVAQEPAMVPEEPAGLSEAVAAVEDKQHRAITVSSQLTDDLVEAMAFAPIEPLEHIAPPPSTQRSRGPRRWVARVGAIALAFAASTAVTAFILGDTSMSMAASRHESTSHGDALRSVLAETPSNLEPTQPPGPLPADVTAPESAPTQTPSDQPSAPPIMQPVATTDVQSVTEQAILPVSASEPPKAKQLVRPPVRDAKSKAKPAHTWPGRRATTPLAQPARCTSLDCL